MKDQSKPKAARKGVKRQQTETKNQMPTEDPSQQRTDVKITLDANDPNSQQTVADIAAAVHSGELVLDPATAGTVAEPEQAGRITALLGTDRDYAWVQIGTEEVQLNTLVVGAFAFSECSQDEWNALPKDQRDALVDSWIAQKQAEANAVAAAQVKEAAALQEPVQPLSEQQLLVRGDATEALLARVAEHRAPPAVESPRQFARGETSSLQHIDELAFADQTERNGQPSQPEPEPPVADNNDTPAIPGGYGPAATSAMHTVSEYVEKMHPKRPQATAEMLRQQMNLYRAIASMINRVEGEEFTRAWNWLLEQFSLYRQGVFAERYVFRGFEDIALPEADRKAFQRLLNLIKATADVRGRAAALKQVDLTKTLELGLTEPGRQRVLQFYGA